MENNNLLERLNIFLGKQMPVEKINGIEFVQFLISEFEMDTKEAALEASRLLLSLQGDGTIQPCEEGYNWEIEKTPIDSVLRNNPSTYDLQNLSDFLTELVGRNLAVENESEESENTGNGEIIRPFEVAKIDIAQTNLVIGSLVNKLGYNEIVLDTEFQRSAGVWDDQRQSRLIESILIKFPLPAFYFDVSDEGKWLVVDGLQRIWTIKNFVFDKKLKLRGLEYLNSEPFNLEGKTFDDLPRDFQRRIEDTNIVTFQIKSGTPAEVKYNLFKRINTGGLVLSPPEIRHALNQGRVANLLKELAQLSSFKQATSYAIPSKRMEDRDFIARFLAFYVLDFENYGRSEFRSDLDGFINLALRELKSWPEPKILELKNNFDQAMQVANKIWGRFSFRKQVEYKRRSPLNKALFEVISSQLAKLPSANLEKLVSQRDSILNAFAEEFTSPVFSASFTVGTGEPARVRLRHQGVKRIFNHFLSI